MTIYVWDKSAGPCLPGATRLGSKQCPITDLLSYFFSIFNQQLINLYQFFHDQSAIDQSAVDKSAVCLSTGQPRCCLYLYFASGARAPRAKHCKYCKYCKYCIILDRTIHYSQDRISIWIAQSNISKIRLI